MIEIIVIVLLCLNKDGSKRTAINVLCFIGIILTCVLAVAWSALAFADTFLYVIFLIIGNLQGGKNE